MSMKQLQKKREELRAEGGFTLMELLIVVAIIAILVAIAIPLFTSSLNRSRAATDEANIRAGYASAMAESMTDTSKTSFTYTLQADGTASENGSNNYECVGNSSDLEGTPNIAGKTDVTWTQGATVTYTIDTTKNSVEIKASK